jgi:hypothetical protein
MLFLRCYYNTHPGLLSLFHTTNKQSPRKISNINITRHPPPKKKKIIIIIIINK